MTLRRRLASQIPPIARRDAKLASQREEILAARQRVASLEKEARKLRTRLEQAERLTNVSVPSFDRQLRTLQRTQVDLRQIDRALVHPLRHLPFKLRNYRLAQSHGVPTPTVLTTWATAGQIMLGELPDAFVVKSDGGAGSHGVLPLRRVSGDTYETVDGARQLTEEQVREYFVSRVEGRKISGPFFAEELIVQPDGGPIPDDIKLYTMYGHVSQVYVRRVGRHGDLSSVSRRYFSDTGEDLGDVLAGLPSTGELPLPEHFDRIVEIGRHLSRAVGLPFARVDLYSTADGPVLGEITRAPGGRNAFVAGRDETMGREWEDAVYRLDLDLLAGRPPGVLHGDRPAINHYPESHVSRSADPGPWEPRVVPCGTWCGPRAPQR